MSDTLDPLKRRRLKSRSRLMSAKELAFVQAYLGTAQGNATEAALHAGYQGDGQVLAQAGQRMLRRPGVKRMIGRALAKRMLTKDEILGELSDIAGSEWRDHLQVKMDREGNVVDAKLNLANKVKALEILGKASGATQDPLSRMVERLLAKELELLESASQRLLQRKALEEAERENEAPLGVIVEGQVTPLDNQVEAEDAQVLPPAAPLPLRQEALAPVNHEGEER